MMRKKCFCHSLMTATVKSRTFHSLRLTFIDLIDFLKSVTNISQLEMQVILFPGQTFLSLITIYRERQTLLAMHLKAKFDSQTLLFNNSMKSLQK